MGKTKLTEHALMRLSERTSMSPQSLCGILDGDEFVSLGAEKDSNRLSKLFFSKDNEQFFIAIQDENTRHVVTILTIEYWHNLSEKFFSRKLTVTRKQLLKAIEIADPSNELLTHCPVMQRQSVNFLLHALVSDDVKMKMTLVGGGGINISVLCLNSTESVINIIKPQFIEKLNIKNISEKDIGIIRWGLGNEWKVNEIEIHETIDYFSLVNAVKNDIYLRNNLFKKYDDFLEVLNQNKNIIEHYERDCK